MTDVKHDEPSASASSSSSVTSQQTQPFIKAGDMIKVNFFSTTLGQYLAASLFLVASVFAFIAVCISLNFAYSMDQIQESKQKATKGTSWFGVFLSMGGMAASSVWIYYINKSVDITPSTTTTTTATATTS